MRPDNSKRSIYLPSFRPQLFSGYSVAFCAKLGNGNQSATNLFHLYRKRQIRRLLDSRLKSVRAINSILPQASSRMYNPSQQYWRGIHRVWQITERQLPLHTDIRVGFSVKCTHRPLSHFESIQTPRNHSLNYNHGLSANPRDYGLHWCQREQHTPIIRGRIPVRESKNTFVQNTNSVSHPDSLRTSPDRADSPYPQLGRTWRSQSRLTFEYSPELVIEAPHLMRAYFSRKR